jgi:hypothetical protein
MSGSGGGGGSRFDSGPGGQSSKCEELVILTPLNSPVPAVVKKLRKDSRLVVSKTSVGGVVRVEVVTSDGEVAGSITSAQMMRLIECMDQGVNYVAVVTNDPTGGLVNLRIQGVTS